MNKNRVDVMKDEFKLLFLTSTSASVKITLTLLNESSLSNKKSSVNVYSTVAIEQQSSNFLGTTVVMSLLAARHHLSEKKAKPLFFKLFFRGFPRFINAKMRAQNGTFCKKVT